MYKYSGYRLDVQWCDSNTIKKIYDTNLFSILTDRPTDQDI